MAELPSGTVTFLFTDLEGSTRLWEEHPGAMKAALARHDAILRDAVAGHRGHVVKTTGDGLHAAFPTAHDAVAAAVTIRHGLGSEPFDATGPLRVRMGAHTCEAELRDGDYYGSGVNRAARLMSVAHGNQIVLSALTAGLCDDAFVLVDLGEHRLRDLSRAERVWQVDVDGERFPSLRSLDNMPGNLPAQLTEFVGRGDDVAAVTKALDAHRIVTLTGVGGVGKTRLALQVAAEVADRFRHGTWFCDLSPVTRPDEVAGAIADALGIDAGATAPDDTLAEWLAHHEALLVVDNCEHVLAEAARIVERLGRECPGITVLATSREGLTAPGEQILALRSLGVPADGATAAAAADTESVRLFVDRARAVRADLPLDERTVSDIADVCRRLDGIPLAIELAAARVQSMTPAEIDERLDQRFRLLTRGSRAALGRQQTLRTTVDWSYQLLEPTEQIVLARASVFVGGFTLAAAEQVVASDAIDRFDVLDHLDALVRRSMLVADDVDGTTRYRLLETIRQFGAERLEESRSTTSARADHLAWCRLFVADAADGLRGPDGIAWVARLDRELANWRAAVGCAVETCDLDALAELFGSITTLALYGTRAGTALATAAGDALAAISVDGAPPSHAASAALLALAGYVQYLAADYDSAMATGLRACAIPEHRDLPSPQLPWGFVFASAFFGQDFETALTAAEASASLAAAAGDEFGTLESSGLRAMTLTVLGRTDEARAATDDTVARGRAIDSPLAEMHSSFMIGFGLSALDDPALAAPYLARAAELATLLENPFFATSAVGSMVSVSGSGGVAEATQLRSALLLVRSLPGREVARDQFLMVARALTSAGRHEPGAVVFGASGASFSSPVMQTWVDEDREALSAALGPDRFDELCAEGRDLTTDEALDLAIAELDAVIADGDTSSV